MPERLNSVVASCSMLDHGRGKGSSECTAHTPSDGSSRWSKCANVPTTDMLGMLSHAMFMWRPWATDVPLHDCSHSPVSIAAISTTGSAAERLNTAPTSPNTVALPVSTRRVFCAP